MTARPCKEGQGDGQEARRPRGPQGRAQDRAEGAGLQLEERSAQGGRLRRLREGLVLRRVDHV